MELAQNRQVAERAMRELFALDIIDNQRDGDLTLSKIADLDYIKRIVKEVLRLTPPIGSGYRRVLRTMEIGVSNDNSSSHQIFDIFIAYFVKFLLLSYEAKGKTKTYLRLFKTYLRLSETYLRLLKTM